MTGRPSNMLITPRANIPFIQSYTLSPGAEKVMCVKYSTSSCDMEGSSFSARPGPEGAALAATLGGRFLALPRADARMLKQAIDAVQPLGKAA